MAKKKDDRNKVIADNRKARYAYPSMNGSKPV